MIFNINSKLRNKISEHKKNKIFYLRSIIHITKYFLIKRYRINRCLIDPSTDFFYKYRKLADYLSIPLLIFAKYLEKKKILISVNNEWNFSVGHLYGEIHFVKIIQKSYSKYSNSTVWFASSKKNLLKDTKNIFEAENFRILIGGIKKIILTLVAIKYPKISIDGSLGNVDYIFANKNLSPRITYNNKSKIKAKLIKKNSSFFPNKEKLSNYIFEKNKLMRELNIFKKYIVIQIKSAHENGTLKPINPDLYIETIKYFYDKDFQIVFAGREKCPKVFLKHNIIDYANSKFISPLNDFLIVGHSSLVISSASGFLNIAFTLDKPHLILNSFHGILEFGRKAIHLPMLMGLKDQAFNARAQHMYLCTYGSQYHKFDKNIFIYHTLTSKEILEGAKELEKMLLNQIPPYTSNQIKIRHNKSCPLISYGCSRISDFFLGEHEHYYSKDKILTKRKSKNINNLH